MAPAAGLWADDPAAGSPEHTSVGSYTPTVSTLPPGWAEANRRMWDERAAVHVRSGYYDVAAFKAGRPAVEPFEVDELGPLGGLRLAHLQCHLGLDTMDLVRMHPGLEAVGLDFSAPAIEHAAALAAELELDGRARFVHGTVEGAASVLGAGSFDVVYTGKGALCWLPDLRRWANECAGLLRPGGWLYVCEFHPVADCLDRSEPRVSCDYFDTGAIALDDPGSYADRDAPTEHNLRYEWHHPLPQLFDAILGAGLELRFFHEWDHTLFNQLAWLERGDDGRYRWPGGPGGGRLPLMYSLKAQKPEAEPSGARP